MIVRERALIGFDRVNPLDYSHHVRQQMSGKSKTVNKSRADTAKKSGAGKPRISAEQKKLRRQQVGMAVFGIILVLAMILSLVFH